MSKWADGRMDKSVNHLTCCVLRVACYFFALLFAPYIALAAETPPSETPERIEAGRQIYIRRCSFCHGKDGDSNGAAADFLNPRPRDFTLVTFKLRSTKSGEPPLVEDLFQTIGKGIPGTAMPSWEGIIDGDDRWNVIYYIRSAFADNFFDYTEEEFAAVTVKSTVPPKLNKNGVSEGEYIYALMKCWECHGVEGRADGPTSGTHKDDWGYPILPRDLTKGWQYKGGTELSQIFFKFTTGLNGTPMPAFTEALLFTREGFADVSVLETVYSDEQVAAIRQYVSGIPTQAEIEALNDEEKEVLTNQRRWGLAQYVKSLIQMPQAAAESQVVIKSKQLKSDLPDTPDDPRWEEAEPLDIPLSGQVIVKPRWHNHSVDLVTVRSLYNDREVAFLLEWNDFKKNLDHQVPDTLLHEEVQFTYVKANKKWVSIPMRDAIAVQFPVKIPDGPRKPHFLRGQPGMPVNLWHWKADWQEDGDEATPAVEEVNAAGTTKPLTPQTMESQATFGKGVWERGRWRLVLKRRLQTGEPQDIQFEPGKLIPIALNAWNGANGEHDLKMSISSWYYLLLETGTPLTAYFYGVLGIVAAVLFERWLIRKARRSTVVQRKVSDEQLAEEPAIVSR